MPDTKITALTALTAADPANDVLPIVDVSDTTMAASGTTKKISINNVLGASGTATLASATITGAFGVNGTANFNGGALAANLNGFLMFGSSGNIVNFFAQSNGFAFKENTGANNLLTISNAGVFGFLDGAGGTRMTINSTGLGVGVVPSAGKGALQLSSGINFPATQVASSDANTLDDYEEGTFTPAVTGGTTAGTATYVGRSGKYTKIGNLVQVQIFIDYNSHTGTGDTRITGLPFTNGANFSAASVGYANGLTLTAGNYVQAYVDASQSFILLNQAPTGGGSNTTVPIDPAATLVITATYTV